MTGQGGYVCVGPSGDKSVVAEFELLFHEILETKNLVNHVIGANAIVVLSRLFLWQKNFAVVKILIITLVKTNAMPKMYSLSF